MARRVTLEQRFWSKVEKTAECWNWTAGLFENGYGTFTWPGPKQVKAHRVAYQLCRGPIPEGLVIDHLCRNKKCVNPDHLEVVTNRENILRGTGITARNAVKTHCPKGHPYDEVNTHRDAKGRACRACNRERFHKKEGGQ